MSDQIPLTLPDLRLLLHYIPACDRDTWVMVGMGIKAEFGNDGWDAWDTWSQSGTGYNLQDAKVVWRSFRKGGTGIGSVIKLAMDNGWKPEQKELSAEDKRRFAREQEARRKQRQAEVEADEAKLAKMRQLVATECAMIWAQHVTPEGESPYLVRKQAVASGVGFMRHTVVLEIDDQAERCQLWVGNDAQTYLKSVPNPRPAHLSMLVLKRGDLVIPLRDGNGHLHALQQINPQGKKLFPKYGRKSGCFHVLGELAGAEVIGLAEGYATASSCQQAMAWPMVMAVDSGNLPVVAAVLRRLCPAARIVVCGDDDPTTAGNPGRVKAEAAATVARGVAVYPAGGEGKDWNDLHVACGLDAVRAQLDEALMVEFVEEPASLPGAPSLACGEPGEEAKAGGALTQGGAGGFRIGEQELLNDFVLIYGTDLVWDCNRRRMVKLPALREVVGRERIKLWQESPHRRVAEDVLFDPTERCGPTMLNLYDGFKMVPSESGEAGCQRILAHLKRLCGERDDEYQFVLRWIAYPLQNPGAKMATSIVMFGAEGPGKSLVWEKVVKRIYGEYGVTIGQAQLESQFTGWQSRKLYALAEEVVSRQEMRHYKGLLKHLVTGETLQINEKMQSLREETNHLNFVFLSNSTVPLELDDGDRRYLVLYVDRVPPPEYFAALVQEIEGGGVQAFYQHMLQLPMDGFNEHTKPPLNAEKQALIEGSLSPARYFLRIWARGELDIPYGAAVASDLYKAFCRWCERANEFKRREREFYQEIQRDLVQVRKDIKFPEQHSDFKTCRIYMSKEMEARRDEDDWAKEVALQCRAFHSAVNDRYKLADAA